MLKSSYFNPRTSYEVRRRLLPIVIETVNFNPRTSYEVRLTRRTKARRTLYFNPRTSYEVRRLCLQIKGEDTNISIHAPLTRCDLAVAPPLSLFGVFQSTHLLRGATYSDTCTKICSYISIHAPLTRCDKSDASTRMLSLNFNPRTSYEVRLPAPLLLARLHRNFNPRTSYEVRQ